MNRKWLFALIIVSIPALWVVFQYHIPSQPTLRDCQTNPPETRIVTAATNSSPPSTISHSPSTAANVTEDPASSKFPPYGVNMWGYIRGAFGIGEATRGVAAALIAAGIPLRIIDAHFALQSIPHRMDDFTYDNYTINTNNPKYYFNIVHMNPSTPRKQFVQRANHYTIGIWWWETEVLPQPWAKSFVLFDELWGGSNFIRKAIQPKAPLPSSWFRFPLPSLLKLDSPQKVPRSFFKIPQDAFVFFFNFDFFSVIQRKNPLSVIRAFRRFEEKVKVRAGATPCLIIKHNNVGGQTNFADQLSTLTAAANGSRIMFIGSLDADKVYSLFATIDCYVSLHRSEGFGLGIAQAMALGKPCIVTDYGGSQDFANSRTAYLVRYTSTMIPNDVSPYGGSGAVWAEPDIETAAKFMLQIYNDPEDARIVGQQAKAFILEHYSPENCGRTMKEHFDTLWRNREAHEYYLSRKRDGDA